MDLAFHYALSHFSLFNFQGVYTVCISRWDCFLLHGVWCPASWAPMAMISCYHDMYNICSERFPQSFLKSTLHKQTYINGSFCQYKFNFRKNLCPSVTLQSFPWLSVSPSWYQSTAFEHSQITAPGEERLCLSKEHWLFIPVPCWSVSTLTRKRCSLEPQPSSVRMAHLLTEISAAGVTVSETQTCLLGIELRPQTHFPQGKQAVSDSNQVM